MKEAYLLTLLVLSSATLDIAFLQESEFGRRILKEQQIVLKSSNSLVDLVINLNNFEQDLVISSQKHMKEYQLLQTNNIERKQALKQKIFLSKYQLQNLGEELGVVAKEKQFAEFIYETRKKLMQEESKFIPQMQAIRNDEIDKLNEVKKELKMTQKILTNMSEAFFELAHFLSKNPNLSESTGFMANTSKQSDVAKFEKMCDEIKSDLESIFLDNPYTMILMSLKPLLRQDNVELLEQVPGILKSLMQALESSTEELEQICSERDDLFVVERNGLKKDIDKRSIECEQIRAIFERTQQQENKLNSDISQLKADIATFQQELEVLQNEIDKTTKDYKAKLKTNMTNLEILRRVKLMINQNKQDYLALLKQKI